MNKKELGSRNTAASISRNFVHFAGNYIFFDLRALASVWLTICLLPLSVCFSAEPLRLLGPVRFSCDQALATKAVPEARAILEKFHQAGYSRAVWAVGALPKGTNAVADWLKTCLAAFPDPPILALDLVIVPTNGDGSADDIAGAPAFELDPSLNSQSGVKLVYKTLSPFLLSDSALEVFLPLALPHVQSVMINYTHLDNLSNKSAPAPTIARVRRSAELARKTAQATGRPVFLWLHVDDGLVAGAGVKEWVDQLGGLVDGFEISRWHEWNAGQETAYAPVLAVVRQSGKPVLRGGFHYVGPRPRPGIEQDLENQYRDGMKTYEAWIEEMGFVGYVREIGAFIPGDVSPNMNLLPTGQLKRER